MKDKKTRDFDADEVSPSKQAATDNYGKKSGQMPAKARDTLGKDAKTSNNF